MTARQIEHASSRVADGRRGALEGSALALAAFGGALAASLLAPDLAVPLLLGAVWAAYAAMRGFVGVHLLLEDLALDRDAHAIPAVRRLALRSASLQHRRLVSSWIRAALDASAGRAERVEANRERLEELARALDDERLALDPAAAVALDRLTIAAGCPLYEPTMPADELGSRLRRVAAGFAPSADRVAA